MHHSRKSKLPATADYPSPPSHTHPLSPATTTTTVSTTATAASYIKPFVPRTTLTVSTLGIPWLRFPLPPRELHTYILRSDGTPGYTSTRAHRSGGSCTLTSRTGAAVATTTYTFGPGKARGPVVTLAASGRELRVESAPGLLTRAAEFEYLGERWRWCYEKEVRDAGEEVGVLVLYYGERRVAELVRGEGTRTPGSSRSSAGNGGVLRLDLDAEEEEGGEVEVVVVASVCVMLKREIDRRRMFQFVAISVAASH